MQEEKRTAFIGCDTNNKTNANEKIDFRTWTNIQTIILDFFWAKI